MIFLLNDPDVVSECKENEQRHSGTTPPPPRSSRHCDIDIHGAFSRLTGTNIMKCENDEAAFPQFLLRLHLPKKHPVSTAFHQHDEYDRWHGSWDHVSLNAVEQRQYDEDMNL
tara:strand:- start:211 stop:549 length:339 start_codon:yes stop_codon:yes gene_type:complete